jgi:RHS repeat-associated protein
MRPVTTRAGWSAPSTRSVQPRLASTLLAAAPVLARVPCVSALSGLVTATTPFGFAGGYTDPSGLIYLMNRYYSPALGQFLSVDPALSQTQQPYEYADGNPVSTTDPTGALFAYVDCTFWHWTIWQFDGCILLLPHASAVAFIRGLEQGSEWLAFCKEISDYVPAIGDYIYWFCGLAEGWLRMTGYFYKIVLSFCGGEENRTAGLGWAVYMQRYKWWFFGWHYTRWIPYLVYPFCWNS